MKSFNRLTTLCAAALLCLTLTACGDPQPNDTPPVTTVPVTDAQSSEIPDGVATGREQTFSYTDKNDNPVTCVYRIPALRFETEDAQTITGEISERYDGLFTAAQQAAEANKSPDPVSINYNAYVNDDVVSLLITAEEQGHSLTYDVYNYNKASGKRLDNEGLLRYLQRDPEDAAESLKKALEADYTSKFKEDNFPDDYYLQLEKSVGDEAVSNAKLFLNGNAELYAVCTEYAGVGNGEFQVLISLAT